MNDTPAPNAAGQNAATRRRWLARTKAAAWLWLALAFGYFCWEGFWYRGLYAILAEWEQARFDWYVPVTGTVLLSLVFGGPPLLIVKLVEWRQRRRAAAAEPVVVDEFAAALAMAEQLSRRLLLFVLVLAGATLIAFGVAVVRVPGDGGKIQLLAAAANGADVHEGPTRLDLRDTPRRGILFRMRWPGELVHASFAQTEARLANGQRLTVFAEIDDADLADLSGIDVTRPRLGVLVRKGLPGTTIAFLNRSGAGVTDPYYCLYRSALSARLRYLAVSMQLLACTVIALLFWIAQRLRVRRMRRRSGTAAPGLASSA